MANNTGSNYTSTTYLDPYKLAKEQYDSVDEQAILDKYNQATAAQYAAQQNQNMIAENNFYNQMYNTQRTAMDTIRQSNAAAVSTGASRGMQAANELSALLGLQQESIVSATELANARRQTAQEETAAMLQNIVQASQDAANQRQQAINTVIQAQSLKATEMQAEATKMQAEATKANTAAELYSQKQTAIAEGGQIAADYYAKESAEKDYDTTYSAEAVAHHADAAQYVLVKTPSADTVHSDYWDTKNTGYDGVGSIMRDEIKSNIPSIKNYAQNELGLTDADIANANIINPITRKKCETLDEWINYAYLGPIIAEYMYSTYESVYLDYRYLPYSHVIGSDRMNKVGKTNASRANTITTGLQQGLVTLQNIWANKTKSKDTTTK